MQRYFRPKATTITTNDDFAAKAYTYFLLVLRISHVLTIIKYAVKHTETALAIDFFLQKSTIFESLNYPHKM
jgi:hypothetical protein